MAYKVDVYFAKAYASITVRDWLSNNICVDTQTHTKLENVAVKASDTFHVLIGQREGAGSVIIWEGSARSDYDIPAELDKDGKITFPKGKTALESQLDDLDAQVKALTQQIAGNKRGR